MENEIVKEETGTAIQGEETAEKKLRKFVMPKMKVVIPVAVVLLLLIAGYFAKGIFIAALVDGSPVYRVSVVRALEKESGAATLDTLIERKLLEASVKDVPVSDQEIDAEYAKIETQITAQGRDLKTVLAESGITEKELWTRISTQLRLETLLADKIIATDQEIAEFIKVNKAALPQGLKGDALNQEVAAEIRRQKLNQEIGSLVSGRRTQATIRYFVDYSGLDR